MVLCWSLLRRNRFIILGLVLGAFLLVAFYQVFREEVFENLSGDSVELLELHWDEEQDHGLARHEDPAQVESDLAAIGISRSRNLPSGDFLLKPDHRATACGRYPDLYRLQFSNSYWQFQSVGNLSFHLYGAYIDNRANTDAGLPVRILAMVNVPFNITVDIFCQFWYSYHKDHLADPKTHPVRLKHPIWYKKWSVKGKYTGYIFTCYVPDANESANLDLPVSVSLVGKECAEASNNLKLENRETQKPSSALQGNQDDTKDIRKRFGVCVKGLDFLHEDHSLKLMEWIELLHILGVDKVFFYEYSVHPRIKKVLDYYEKREMIEITPLTLPGVLPNEPNFRHLFLSHRSHSPDKRKNEVIPYNDCLYRNYQKFDYLAVLDTDEVIIPKSVDSWQELVTKLDLEALKNSTNKKKPVTTYCFRNLYFFDSLPPEGKEITAGIPSHLHMLKHVYRAANYTPPSKFVKCIHSTSKTALVHNHFPLGCLDGICNIHHADISIAHLQHYRSTCVRDLKNCEDYEKNPVKDAIIWKYRDELIKRVNKALSQLQLSGER